jgi:hypothetical protein
MVGRYQSLKLLEEYSRGIKGALVHVAMTLQTPGLVFAAMIAFVYLSPAPISEELTEPEASLLTAFVGYRVESTDLIVTVP